MKNKGLYTSGIALIAIVIITVVAFNSVSTVKANESRSNGAEIAELKWQWQNAYYLLGKSAADALADASWDGSNCEYESIVGQDSVNDYFSQVLQSTYPECSFSQLSIVENIPGEIIISITLKCEKRTSPDFLIVYGKDVYFNKEVNTSIAGGTCTVVVTDLHSGNEEVRQTA